MRLLKNIFWTFEFLNKWGGEKCWLSHPLYHPDPHRPNTSLLRGHFCCLGDLKIHVERHGIMCSRCIARAGPQTPVGWVGHLCASTVSREVARRRRGSSLWWAVGRHRRCGVPRSRGCGESGLQSVQGVLWGWAAFPQDFAIRLGWLLVSGASGRLSPRGETGLGEAWRAWASGCQ